MTLDAPRTALNAVALDEDLEPGEIAPRSDSDKAAKTPPPPSRTDCGDVLADRRRSRRRSHRSRSHSPERRRSGRSAQLSYYEREEMRRHARSPSAKMRHRRDDRHHRERRSKKHKRHHHHHHHHHHRSSDPQADAMDIDDRAAVAPEVEDVVEEWSAVQETEEEIEKQREERRRRIAAIKTKHQKSTATLESRDVTGGMMSELSEEGKGGEVRDSAVLREATPESVSSADCALVERRNGVEKEMPLRPEVDTDEHLKSSESMERTDCSADRRAILNDEKHDKEKLLNCNDDHPGPNPLKDDMDVDDIFCETPENGATKTYQGLDNAVKKATANRGLMDAYDDPEGYYKFRIGEILDNRYEIISCKGKGVFSTVLHGKDKVRKDESGDYPEVCIKVIRANDHMRNCGKREEQFLKRLASNDPENKRHCIRLLRSFVYRGHLCLAFEPMAMNLRELTKKFGRDVGLSLNGVGHFTAQLLVALKHLKLNKLLHADIKPDNILVNEKFSRVKLCDFGSAMEDWSIEITPYVCSRFYRPPEVILGLKYGYGMDMWSLGCVIYEMFTGQYLFPGRTNNAMLKHMMDAKGAFPKKLLKKAAFCDEHFEKDANMSFIEIDVDKFTKKPTKRLVSNPTVKHNFHALLSKFAEGCQPRLVTQLADLLEKMMMLDPEKRIDVDDAIRHPFVRAFLHKAKNAQHQKPQDQTESAIIR